MIRLLCLLGFISLFSGTPAEEPAPAGKELQASATIASMDDTPKQQRPALEVE